MNQVRTRRGLVVLVVLLLGLSLVAPGAATPVEEGATGDDSFGGGLTDSPDGNTTDSSGNSTSSSDSDTNSTDGESFSDSDSGTESNSTSSPNSSDSDSSDSFGSDSSDSDSSNSFDSESSDSNSSDSFDSHSSDSNSSDSFDSRSSDANSTDDSSEEVLPAADEDGLLRESLASIPSESASTVTSLDSEAVGETDLVDVDGSDVLDLTDDGTAATTVSDTVSTAGERFSTGRSGTTDASGDAARVQSTDSDDDPVAPVDGETAAIDPRGGDDTGDTSAPRNAVGLPGAPDDLPGEPVNAGAILGLVGVAAAVTVRQSTALSGMAGGMSTSVGTAASSVPGSSHLDRLVRSLAPFRYSRYDDSDPLEHEAREEMFAVVEDSPGTYLSEIAERADLPLSTARHHIRVLEREDLVSGAKVRGKRRFYPAHTEGVELAAAMNDDSTAAVIDALARLGAASVSDLADELDKDPSTVTHHVQRLEEDDVVVRERDGRAVMNKLSPAARTMLEPGDQRAEGPAAGEAMASD